MRKSEVEMFWDEWLLGSSRVFLYKREFYPNDYICIRREVDYVVVEQDTSKVLQNIDKDKILEMMTREDLIWQQGNSGYLSMYNLKTGGCTCGAFILGEDSHHDSICDKAKFKSWYS